MALTIGTHYVDTLFRGAASGIEQFVAGSYFTADHELAQGYANLERKNGGMVYEVAINQRLNLMEAECTEDLDDLLNAEYITDEALVTCDGILFENRFGDQTIVCLFGRVSLNGTITKLSVDEIRADLTASFRRYDR